MRNHHLPVTAALFFLAGSVQAQISLGIDDDFEAGPGACVADGWTEGAASPNPPTATASCGAAGSCCLANDSAGGFGPGSRQVTYNESQWAGDYIAAGVNKIRMQIANPGSTALSLRVGLTNGTTCYVSSEAVGIPPGLSLESYSFLLTESAMALVPGNTCGGAQSLATVLSNVTQLRIVSAANIAWAGDAIVSSVRFDNIQSSADSDEDGVDDDSDNCTLLANPDQRDTDSDGYGNVCDPDLNNDCAVNFLDLGLIKDRFFGTDPDADFDGNGSVNFADLGIMKAAFFEEPGPGLGVCDACVPPEPLGSNADFGGLEMFVRGALINDWGAVSGLNSFSDQSGGLYVARFEAPAGSYEFKVADADWSIEYCSTTNQTAGVTNELPLYGCAFPANGTIEIPASGCYEFTMQTDGGVPPASVDLTFEVAP